MFFVTFLSQNCKISYQCILLTVPFYVILEDTARYAGLLLAPSEVFFVLRAKKKRVIKLFLPIFGNLLCSVVNFVTVSSNLSNFERNRQKPKNFFLKIQKISKNFKISKNPKIANKSKKSPPPKKKIIKKDPKKV